MSRELPAEFTERPSEQGLPRSSPLPEAESNATQQLLRAIFDSSDDGMLLLDSAGTVLSSNDAFAALCGVQVEILIGRHWLELCARAGIAFPCELIYASLTDGRGRSERIRLRTANGIEQHIELRTTPLEVNGHPLGMLMVRAQNMTALTHLEEQLAEAERFAGSRQLAATVAHEVKTPLQAIESCLHLASKLPDAEQRGRYLRLARDEIQRVGQILQQLLDLYRPVSSRSAPLALNDLVERSLLLVGSSLARRGIVVQRELAEGLPTLMGRADELTQVLLNLILNAMQAMRRGGTLTLATSLEHGEGRSPCLTLTVSDTGLGIEVENLGRIFEPFFTTRPEGNGLGLTVSQRIITGHGGAIGVVSTPGEGTSFCVSLPLLVSGDTAGA